MSKTPTVKWYEVHPPRDLALPRVTALVRALASRPKQGLLRTTPIVVFELRISKGVVRWLFGHGIEIGGMPHSLTAQLPGLTFTPLEAGELRTLRPITALARDVRVGSISEPLRLDTAGNVSAGLYELAEHLHRKESVTCQWVIGPSSTPGKTPPPAPLEALGILEPRTFDAGERQAWKAKVAEPLHGVRGRLGVVSPRPERCASLLHGALAALQLAQTPRARISASRPSPMTARQLDHVMGRVRSWSLMVNAAELATLLAWPLEGAAVPINGLRIGPPPTKLLTAGNPRHERILGAAVHPSAGGKLVRLPVESCLTHVQVISPTGTGKSTNLARWTLQDAQAGRSIFVVEPRGDLIADVLARLPKSLHDRVVVIDPGVKGNVVGLNPLAGPTDDAERRADQLLQVFKELFGSAIGPRSSDVLYHSLLTASRLSDGTVVDAVVLLTNPAFRRKALAKVSDPLVLAPFWAGFEAKSEAEQSQIVGPVLNKLRVLTARANIRRLLGQAAPRFSLDDLFQGEQLLVFVNLNRGILGRETSRLLGCLPLTEAWAAIERRAAMPPATRHPVMCVVDEWPSFTAGLDFAEVLAQSRGLGASWTVVSQDLSQTTPQLRAATAANCRSRMVFRPAHDDAKTLAGLLGEGVAATDLQHLAAYHAVSTVLVDGASSPPFEVASSPLPPATGDAAAIAKASTDRYGVNPDELDQLTVNRWQGTTASPDDPIGFRRRRQP